jgi:hypothetical protein
LSRLRSDGYGWESGTNPNPNYNHELVGGGEGLERRWWEENTLAPEESEVLRWGGEQVALRKKARHCRRRGGGAHIGRKQGAGQERLTRATEDSDGIVKRDTLRNYGMEK